MAGHNSLHINIKKFIKSIEGQLFCVPAPVICFKMTDINSRTLAETIKIDFNHLVSRMHTLSSF